MPITDYASLQASIASWLHRDDLTALIPDFIALAEERMSDVLDARLMEQRTVLNISGGVNYITLPDDLTEMRRFVLQTDPKVVLKYVTPDEIDEDYGWSMTGRPLVFTVIGGQMQLAPIPDADYTAELTYQQRVPALSVSNTTNWLLISNPSIYLYGALLIAQPFIADDNRISVFAAFYKESVDSLNSVDWYSGSTMRVRAK
jgi:hypothetical protein